MTNPTTPAIQGDAVRVAAQALIDFWHSSTSVKRDPRLYVPMEALRAALAVRPELVTQPVQVLIAELNQIGVYGVSFNGTSRTDWQEGWNACNDVVCNAIDKFDAALVAPPALLRVEPCPNATHMGEHACQNRHRCWEPCGELGRTAEHARVVELMGKPATAATVEPVEPVALPVAREPDYYRD